MTELSLPPHHTDNRRQTRSSKGTELVKAIPPSPAPSNAEIPRPNGHPPPMAMADYMHHNTSNYYPSEPQHTSMELAHPQSQPATRYSTPVQQQRAVYQPPQNQQMLYASPPPQQQQQQYSYPVPPQHHHQNQYAYQEDFHHAVSDEPHPQHWYRGRETDRRMPPQHYSTPATSPPSPLRNTETRVTRRGKATAARKASPAPRKKKVEKTKAVKKSPHLSGPMSEITKDSPIPVIDIETYVNRSAEERRQEVREGKIPGKIKRPMNAFMLYRKAYQNRAKGWCSQHNHQVVSQVCGQSWPLEPDRIRQQFNDWAKLERDNHQKAHPGYKFTPSKPHKPKLIEPGQKRYFEDGDDSDPEWNARNGSLPPPKRVRITKRETPFDDDDDDIDEPPRSLYAPPRGHQGMQQEHLNRSAFQTSNPGRPMPQPYEPTENGQYYQMSHLARNGAIEDVAFRKTRKPNYQHHSPPPQQQHQQLPVYDMPPYLAEQHQVHHHQQDLHHQPYDPDPLRLGAYPGNQATFPTGIVDPSLMSTGGELYSMPEGQGAYPHTMDPAAYHNSQARGVQYQHQFSHFNDAQQGNLQFGNTPLEDFMAYTDASLAAEDSSILFDKWEIKDAPEGDGDDWLPPPGNADAP